VLFQEAIEGRLPRVAGVIECRGFRFHALHDFVLWWLRAPNGERIIANKETCAAGGLLWGASAAGNRHCCEPVPGGLAHTKVRTPTGNTVAVHAGAPIIAEFA
jgi:hypothetical protein